MNLLHYYEELDAMNAAADRFAGFDRGDLDRTLAQEDAETEAKYEEELDEMMLAGQLIYGPDTLEQHEAWLASISAPPVLGLFPDDDIDF